MIKKKTSDTAAAYTLFTITECDPDGELWASPQKGEYSKQKFPLKRGSILPALTVGDEFLGKFKKNSSGCFVKPVARLSGPTAISRENIFGVVERQNHICTVVPIERGAKPCLLGADKTLKNGDLVEIELTAGGKNREAALIKNYGPFTMERLNEILIAQKYKLPHVFDRDILKECRRFDNFENNDRISLAHLPLVTIDGDDSRDFDDAVYAARTPEGFDIIVAIADVSFYVRPGSCLDREACRRGNSVYLPQTVIPMLPEILSNDLCSLNPGVRRPVLACLMQIDHEGNLLRWEFKRAVIKSAARLTYKEVEAAINGSFNAQTKKLFTKVLQPLYEAYFAFEKARRHRGTLELETTEIKIRFAKDGTIQAVEKQQPLTSHKIIEEFMIAANVAAARRLQQSKLPVMYRVHERPTEEKLKEIKPLLETLKLKLPDYNALKPQHFNRLLELCRQKGNASGIDDLILRLQCQARYSPENIGHFGLGLDRYVHFTSPIRRYADLLIHRALLNTCRIEEANESLPSPRAFNETAEHLCVTERNAVAAERDLTARYLSLYLKPLVGTDFEVKVSGLSNAGIFVRIDNLGAEGLIPMRSLPRDYYRLLDAGSCLRGIEGKQKFRLGQTLTATLVEAAPVTGGLIFRYLPEPDTFPQKPKTKKASSKRSKNRKPLKTSSRKKERKSV